MNLLNHKGHFNDFLKGFPKLSDLNHKGFPELSVPNPKSGPLFWESSYG